MAYTPTTWATGDTLTAAAMNKIEQGVAACPPIGLDVIVYYSDSNSGYYALGDLSTVADKLANGIPVIGVYVYSSNTPKMSDDIALLSTIQLVSLNPATIELYKSNSNVCFTWTSSGVTFTELGGSV